MSNDLDRFSLKVDGKVDQGLRLTAALDLNVLAEELVDRLREDDLVDFIAGIVEAFGDIDTTERILGRISDIRAVQEREALEAEAMLDRHG